MRKEHSEEADKMRNYKEELEQLITTTANVGTGGSTGIDDVAEQRIKANMADLKKEMKRVKQHIMGTV